MTARWRAQRWPVTCGGQRFVVARGEGSRARWYVLDGDGKRHLTSGRLGRATAAEAYRDAELLAAGAVVRP